MAHRLNAQAFLYHNELLKLTDELFVKLAKGKVGNLEPVIDELSETATSIDIGRSRKKLHIVIIDNEVMLDRCIDILNK